MTSPTAATVLDDPLAAAVKAEERLWEFRSGHTAGTLADRNAAVRRAVAAGYTRDEVAQALGMRPNDITRILER